MSRATVKSVTGEATVGKCLYFSFGSNMSKKRIGKNCPSNSDPAEFIESARLDHHALQFCGPDWPSWNGAVATVTETLDECCVWGVLWKISQQHLANLDKQEGNSYKRIKVCVTTKSGIVFVCYTYVMCADLAASLPSKPYLETIIEGAVEHGLPREYVEALQNMPHNGYTGAVNPP